MSSVVLSNARPVEADSYSYSRAMTVALPSDTQGGRATPLQRTHQYSPKPPASHAKDLKGFAIKRRLKGFVLDTTGDTWRVLFVENGERFPYNLPAQQLRDVGVEAANQPFEMDEMVSKIPGVSGKVYRFRPAAKVHDCFQDTLVLDSDRQKKRAFILSKLGKSKA